jgi:histidinol-phosphate aminotransferase
MTTAYSVPRSSASLDLYLDSNEGPRPEPHLLDGIDPVETLRRYPNARPLEVALAARLGLASDRVLVTAGGDDAIDRLCRVWLGPGKRLVLPSPGFEMVARYALATGATVIRVPWGRSAFPVDAVLGITAPDVIVVTSPNNPTGSVVSAGDLRRLSEGAPHALLLVDLAYAEFAEVDLTDTAASLPNAIVIRTLSKAWGLAGLRVGYAIGAPGQLEQMRAVGPPYAVSGLSLSLARAALERDTSMRAYVEGVREERVALFGILEALGARPLSSEANFIFAEVEDPLWVRDAVASLGIAIRAFPDRPGLEQAIRVSCPGNRTDLARVASALRCALAPEALLFDMDGVLVDVSRSYRVAIRQTAAAFGVRVTDDDVTREKQKGHANNDWVLTRRLLASAGVEVPQLQVTRAFEEVYQGGLWTREVPLVDRDTLAELAARLPLAVVTGRPRRDAERFLGMAGFSEVFEEVVTLEDAPGKPNPAPIRLAMEQLNVERAWMVGDTVDDLNAARAAGIVSLGFGGEIRGAGRVLGEIGELRGLLCALSN